MSRDSSHREHIHRVMLNAVFYVGISKLMAKRECSKSAAVLYALNEGLFRLDVIKKEDYEFLAERYGRKLKEVIEEAQKKREPSHVPVLTIEQTKEQLRLTSKNGQFKGMIDQWKAHPQTDWRNNAVADGEKWKDRLQSARDLLELSRKTTNIGCEETEKKIVMVDETTCVGDALPAVQTDFAWKMSAESLVSDALDMNALLLTQNLHM